MLNRISDPIYINCIFKEQAIMALKLVNFRSVTAAAEILLNISKDPRLTGNLQVSFS